MLGQSLKSVYVRREVIGACRRCCRRPCSCFLRPLAAPALAAGAPFCASAALSSPPLCHAMRLTARRCLT